MTKSRIVWTLGLLVVIGVLCWVFLPRNVLWVELGQYDSHPFTPHLCEGDAAIVHEDECWRDPWKLAPTLDISRQLDEVQAIEGYHVFAARTQVSYFHLWSRDRGSSLNGIGGMMITGDFMLVGLDGQYYLATYSRNDQSLSTFVLTSAEPKVGELWRYAAGLANWKLNEWQGHSSQQR